MRLSNRLKRVKKKGEIDIDMKKERLDEILKAHSIWLETRFTDDVKGERANLRGADLRGANLRGAVCPICCPEKGSFIGFKKVLDDYIVELRITETAKRSSATTRKCRCSEAVVMSITTLEGKEAEEKTVFSTYDPGFFTP